MCFICDETAMQTFSKVAVRRKERELFLSKVKDASNKDEIQKRKNELEETNFLIAVLLRYKFREENCFVLERDTVCEKHKEVLILMIQYRWIIPIYKKEKLIEPLPILLKTVLERVKVK